MGKVFDCIDQELADWIYAQHVFFVATAPLSSSGLVNCSPKGLNCFRVLDPLRVIYLDMHGSGIETVSHLRENGRIVLMFCAFNGSPRIVRLHGSGAAHEVGTPKFEELQSHFSGLKGGRSVIEIGVTRVSDSCGYGVPMFDFVEQRSTLCESAERRGPDGLARSRERNRVSLDGLPGMRN